MIDVKKLKKDEEDRNKLKTKGFIKILGLINNKIFLIAKTKQKSTWFEIPLFILGFPTYELKESSDFLIKKLEKHGFKANFLEPNILFISWE